MTVEIASALRLYFETLYNLNRNLIKCCGLDAFDLHLNYKKPLYDIIEDIPKLMPYAVNKTTREQIISERNGLLEFSSDLPFLNTDYEKILVSNYSFLNKIRLIRNKLEHRMHGVKMRSTSNGSSFLFEVSYEVEAEGGIEEITLTAEEFIKFVKQLNDLFSKLQKNLSSYVYENDKEDSLYYEKLLRFDFSNFNKIYDSDLLRIFGRTLFPF